MVFVVPDAAIFLLVCTQEVGRYFVQTSLRRSQIKLDSVYHESSPGLSSSFELFPMTRSASFFHSSSESMDCKMTRLGQSDCTRAWFDRSTVQPWRCV